MKRFFFTLLVILLAGSAFAADPLDSLTAVLKTAEGERKVKTLNELFRYYINSDPVKAIGYTKEALALAIEINDRKGVAASYNNRGVAYRNQGALDQALENYMSALRIYDNLKNKEGIATTKNNIGNIYSLKKDFGQSMKYFEDSYELFTEIGDQEKVIGSMNNLGNLHSDLQLYEQALKYFSQAYQLAEKSGKVFSDPLNNIGNLYFRQGNYQRAVEYYERALELAKKENNRLSVLEINANLGEVYTKAGQTAKAQQYLDIALGMSEELQVFIVQPQILKSLANNYYRQEKMKEAYETLVKYDVVKEKIFGEESSRKIAQMEMALNLQETEKEIDLLRKEDLIKTLQLRNTRTVVTTVIIGIIVGIALLNIFMGKRNRKNLA